MGSPCSCLSALNQGEQFVGGELAADIGAREQAVGQVAFGFVQGDDLIFDRALGNEAVNGDGALLADAVSAIALASSPSTRVFDSHMMQTLDLLKPAPPLQFDSGQ